MTINKTKCMDSKQNNFFIKTPLFIKNLFPYSEDIDHENLKVTKVGLYSISNRHDSGTLTKILEQCIQSWGQNPKNMTLTDATAGIGGNTISFAQTFGKVNAIEINNIQYKALVNNLKEYKFNNVDSFFSNCLTIVPNLTQDVIFIDPPWGGKKYKQEKYLKLKINNINLSDIINHWKKSCKNLKMVVIKIPKNFDMSSFSNKQKFPFLYLWYFRKYNIIILSKIHCQPIEHRQYFGYKNKRRNSN
jgi:16S rRNA G966 N2-methylase RsmD